ncbi:MAG: BON domain-containing protein [Phenylobacterium sp.]|uniref:BON domain-containing protein n=1 Tax=Phenylobacterium sp. TaxID=1871053 RepID=UPI0027283275|nr:BON domain-containing protein [Phenylobacterium sp.]MDO8902894.1 BON domain-containing protein [Phenylobacterium sp.]
MADRWTEDQEYERIRAMRGDQDRRAGGYGQRDEEARSFSPQQASRGPVFGERESGAAYGRDAEGRTMSREVRAQPDRDRIYGEGYFGQEGYAMEQGGFGGPAAPPRASTRDAYARVYGGHERRIDRGEDRGFWDRTTDEVASWFGDDEAERRRDRDHARSHRGRGPKGYVRPDDRISDDVHHHLTDDPWIDASEIQVQVKDGEVTLSGTVDDRRAKHRAEHCVEDIHGVKHVQNNLRVQPRVDQALATGQPARMAANTTLAKVSDGEE